ncbi:MAG TPA: LysM domain-containing protein [Bacillota bacterium]|nr:LysM domain-containing protein [Bacillota bacterium]
MSVQCPPGATTYIIRAGDTLFSLAERFGTTVAAILAANPGLDPNALQVGRTICIPAVPRPGTCPAGRTPYIIRAGDTLFSLAERFGTTVAAILAANPGLDPNALRIGQNICIPGVLPPTGCPTGTTTYTIRAGDTLFSLAQRFGTTVAAILAANPGLNPNALRIGQNICIPGVIPPTTCPAGSTTYSIRAGDSLYRIALRLNTSVAAILALNPGINPTSLQIGQVICIPTAGPTGPMS